MASPWKPWFPAGYGSSTPRSQFERSFGPLPDIDRNIRHYYSNRAGRGTRGHRRNPSPLIAFGKGHIMISRRTCVISLAVGTLLAAGLPASAKSGHISPIRLLDTA